MKITAARFQTSTFLAPARTLEFHLLGAPVRLAWSTPARWGGWWGAVLLAGLLFALAARHAVTQRQAAFQSIAGDCAPSIIAAQHIRASLADYDANLTNELLCAPGSPDLETAAKAAWARRQEFTDHLLQAAANITFGEAERGPITTVLNELGNYEAGMARAQALQSKGDAAGAVAASREAARLMRATILPAVDALDAANGHVLDRTYAAQQGAAWRALAWTVAAGLFLLAALGGAQRTLWRATRRRINPGLLAATLLTAGFALYGLAASVQSGQRLKETTKDAFDSVRFLWRARATAYAANAAESRWLHDRARAAVSERDFAEETARIAQAPAHVSLREIAATARAHPEHPLTDGFRGLLAQELGNVTYEGELAAAAACVEAFGDYLAVDKEIRRLENAGQHAQAVALCLSYSPGGSNAAFERFDAALDKVLNINVAFFHRFADDGESVLRVFDWLIPGFAMAVALLVGVGFWPRIQEYRT